jgi:hypothetical protein
MIGAFALLSTILTSFYDTTGSVGDAMSSGQDGIFLTTMTTSYIEMAQGLAFDEITDTMHVGLANANTLTSPFYLGPETGEDSLQAFDDFDDFDGYTMERTAGTSGRRYRTRFAVHYVDPNDIEQTSSSRTFVKRLDMMTWRTFPVPDSVKVDTLRASFVMGYFHFD